MKHNNYFPVTQLLDQFFAHPFGQTIRDNFVHYSTPMTNVQELEDAYSIEMAVPGTSKEDIKIEIVKDFLEISFTQTEKKAENQETYIRKDFSQSSWKRTFHITEKMDVNQIKATCEHGILTIQIAKKQPVEPVTKKIEIL